MLLCNPKNKINTQVSAKCVIITIEGSALLGWEIPVQKSSEYY